MSLKQLQNKLLVSLVLGLGVLLALSLFSDVQAVVASLGSFQWAFAPLILLFTVLNYLLRWAKWEYYLRYLQMGQGVSYADSGLIFTAGLVMSVTPGKVGEVFKSFLLRRINNTPVSASAPIVLVERLTDGLAMLLLMALGLTLYPPARVFFVLLLALTVVGIAIVQYRPLCDRILAWIATVPPFGDRIAPKLITLHTSILSLLDWRILLVSTLLSFVSWGFECIAFYYVLVGLGVEGSGLLLLQATFIFAASTLFGLVTFLPGGLGTSEASSVALLIALVGVGSGLATAATIIIRFGTLWFGVILGFGALLWFLRRQRLSTTTRLTGDQPPGTPP